MITAQRREENAMGTWGTGPFDNDTAADFANALDDAGAEEREALIRGVLVRAVNATDELSEAEEAVGAAAVLASQCPGGQPVDPVCGPETPMPEFSTDLRVLAAEALTRIAADDDGLVSNWVEPGDAHRWLAMVAALRAVLDPPPPSMDIPLFDLET
ncbi:DUF4259 domain-containing protein [Kitasatospora sp. NRRL B-11411]|uniref:DUF4259 domain-containing protein n=1 Tax=Kitasatospora sp. NRRL B-11411 TaxID=1463822 RepID=UPI001E2D785E|nr:DUF4259 domain-containing protein [Kitasatospora sp. NRRL B-11411]